MLNIIVMGVSVVIVIMILSMGAVIMSVFRKDSGDYNE